MITTEFIVGFGFGVIITALLGWIWLLYRDWVKASNAVNRSQLVIQPTPMTPAQVQSAASRAEVKILLLRLVLLLIGWLVFEILFPEGAQIVHGIVVDLWQLFWGA